MSAPDRDKLRAGLSGLLSGAPPAEDSAPPAPVPSEMAPPAARPKRRSAAPKVRPPASTKPSDDVSPEEGEHVRTTTGYVKADGERVHRVSIMLTKEERRRLRELAEDEGVSITDLVRRTLRL